MGCDEMMEYFGYEKGESLDEGKIIESDKYDTDSYAPHIFLNFQCPHCKKKISVMTH